MLELIVPVCVIVLMEAVLSLDNATALATMVRWLPEEQRAKALRYWILGAYAFRGAAILLAAHIVQIAFLKLLWWAYLLYLAWKHFSSKEEGSEAGKKISKASFWKTVALVECMDLVFSLDNVLAAVALSPNVYVVMTGVAIGILAMRFAAGWFMKLLERYPDLENSAFVVIGMLGAKLVLSYVLPLIGAHAAHDVMESHSFMLLTSVLTLAIFSYPFIKKRHA